MTEIRIMLAENDPVQAQALATVLSRQDGLEIISTVSSRETAVKQLSGLPDIMLLNLDILEGHTLSRFIHSVQDKSPRTKLVLVLQGVLSDEVLISEIKSGIRGYVKISDPPNIMVKAMRSVHEGRIWAERRVLEKAMSMPMLLPETLRTHIPESAPLTNREMEMLTLVLQGASNKEIADKSSISERTVKTHLYRVYRKLNVKSRTKAIALLSHS
jgi:two-component system response regulator DegU